MLAGKEAMATIAVKNIEAAKKFYGDTLGLKKAGEEMEEVVTYHSGKSTIIVYESKFAGTNRATSATWGVGDELETIVSTLKKKGVPFEHYDMPGLERDGDIHCAGDFRAAWFKDPDGNILHINSEKSN
jgi:catechol 2,3-dioxygenase-like lactoylglutathione lyase family enzyme